MSDKPKTTLSRATTQYPALTEVELEDKTTKHTSRPRLPRQIENWLERCKLLGMQTYQLVWELHVIQGRSKQETATLLGVTRSAVWQHYEKAKAEITERAPVSAADFTAMREEVKDRLLATYEMACRPIIEEIEDVETGAMVKVEVENTDPRNLAIRLKCLEQLSKMYGLNLERESGESDKSGQYAPPDEIIKAVRERALAEHGRAQDVADVVKALTSGE